MGVASHWQWQTWAAESLIHPALFQTNQPYTVLRGLAQLALAAGCALDDSQAPVTLATHHHLPVMAAPREALAGQDTSAVVEALGLASPSLGKEATVDHRVALRELQERVGSSWVELERFWSWKRKRPGVGTQRPADPVQEVTASLSPRGGDKCAVCVSGTGRGRHRAVWAEWVNERLDGIGGCVVRWASGWMLSEAHPTWPPWRSSTKEEVCAPA